jgi:hypothetical protein
MNSEQSGIGNNRTVGERQENCALNSLGMAGGFYSGGGQGIETADIRKCG